MRYFRLLCWLPVAAWVWARLEVDRYDGWGAWAAAPLLLGPVALSALFVGVGLILVSRPGDVRPGSADWVAIGVSSLPLLWIALRILSSQLPPHVDLLPDARHVLTWLGRVVAVAILAIVLDRVLLAAESRGWIFYRRTRGFRGRAMYHAQELDSIFNPGMQHVQEAHVKEEQQEDESGDPPVLDPGEEGA